MPDFTEVNATDNPTPQLQNRCFFMPAPTTILKGSESKLFVLSDTSNIDLRVSDTYYKNITENTTFTFSNKPRRNMTKTIRVIVDRASDYTVTWPNDVTWNSGDAPALKLGTNIFEFMIYNDSIIGSMINDDSTGSGAAASAAKLDHNFTLKIKNGSFEGSTKYTFDGSADKTLNFAQGSNVTLTGSNNTLTIAAADTHCATHLYAGRSGYIGATARSNGEMSLVIADDLTVRESVKITGTNGVTVTSDNNNNITIAGSGGGSDIKMYPIIDNIIERLVYDTSNVTDRNFDLGEYGSIVIKFLSSWNGSEVVTYSIHGGVIPSNVEYELTELEDAVYEVNNNFDFEYEEVDGLAIKIETNGSTTESPDVRFATIGNSHPSGSSSQYNTWQYVLDEEYDGTDESIIDSIYWNAIEFDASAVSDDDFVQEYFVINSVSMSSSGGSGGSEANATIRIVNEPEFAFTIKKGSDGKFKFFLTYIPSNIRFTAI